MTSWLTSCGTLAGTVQVGETVAVGVLVRAVRDAGRDRALALTRLMLGSGTASGGLVDEPTSQGQPSGGPGDAVLTHLHLGETHSTSARSRHGQGPYAESHEFCKS